MNLLAHMAVARRLRDEPEFLLGSALPDLASPVRARLTMASGVEPLDDGVRVHHRTDAVFHGLPWFVDLQRDLGVELRRRGVGRGPARASAHVGIELLLDGVLERDPSLVDDADGALEALVTHRGAVTAMAAPESAERWTAQVGRIVGRARPQDGTDPEAVAARLERICARRPRLAFGDRDRREVADVLAEVSPEIERAADDVVASVVAGL